MAKALTISFPIPHTLDEFGACLGRHNVAPKVRAFMEFLAAHAEIEPRAPAGAPRRR